MMRMGLPSSDSRPRCTVSRDGFGFGENVAHLPLLFVAQRTLALGLTRNGSRLGAGVVEHGHWILAPGHGDPAVHKLRDPELTTEVTCRVLVVEEVGSSGGNLADDFLRQALDTQTTVIATFADLPPHNQVVREFLRLRLAQVHHELSSTERDLAALDQSRDLLETSIENLSRLITRPELTEDRLAQSSLPVAYAALGRVLDELGETGKAEHARATGNTIRSSSPDGRRYPWGQ